MFWLICSPKKHILFATSVFIFSLLIIPCLQLICYWFHLIHFPLVLVLLRCWRRLGSLKCRFQRQRKTPILFPIVVKTERERFGFSFVLEIENNYNSSKRRNSSDNNKNKGWYNNSSNDVMYKRRICSLLEIEEQIQHQINLQFTRLLTHIGNE